MKKILLTSTGLDNIKIKENFLEFLKKDIKEVKALFVTTAAVEPDAIMVLPFCLEDLLNCNIPKENITVYDMHKALSITELKKYDVMYVCGGKTTYLADRIKELNMSSIINQYVNQGGIYIGVSAGSVVASGKYKDGLHFIENIIDVHCEQGTENGVINSLESIYLTDNQAICITDGTATIIG